MPIPIYISYFKSLFGQLLKFIWNGKKARCSRSNLTLQKSVEGAGLEDIYNYYCVVRMDHLKFWFKEADGPLWHDVESARDPTGDLMSLLMSDFWKPWDTSTLSPPNQTTSMAWRLLYNQHPNMTIRVEYNYPLCLLEAMVPLLSTKLLSQSGINYAHEFANASSPKNVEVLVNEFNLSENCVLYLHTHFPLLRLSPHPRNTCKL